MLVLIKLVFLTHTKQNYFVFEYAYVASTEVVVQS